MECNAFSLVDGWAESNVLFYGFPLVFWLGAMVVAYRSEARSYRSALKQQRAIAQRMASDLAERGP